MGTPDSATHPARCLRCRRILRRPSVDGYGPKCRLKIRRAAPERLPDFKPHQVAKAVELLELGGLVPLRQNRIFLVVSDDGTEVYRSAATGQCNCPAGLRSAACYHAAAARLVAAA
ncbi:hypothetical protein [Streptomyces sp. PA03-2a]|jgi:hypothetical protein|uniref:hypothetical protein n=1 Tax=Streptomyces sp. PA03-2a TaxID=3028701 RepID=UPI0029B755DB|nr:hypothetical protein [Streptomyces sp. PA03-2a]MDX2732888.1 hypothetical protein [Streptomyces sp. PA03-2a]